MAGTAARGVDVTLGDGVDVTVGDEDVETDGDGSCVLVADVGAVPPGGATDFVDSPDDVLHAAIRITADVNAVARQNPPVRGAVIGTAPILFFNKDTPIRRPGVGPKVLTGRDLGPVTTAFRRRMLEGRARSMVDGWRR